MMAWRSLAQTVEDAAGDLLTTDVPDVDLLELLNSLERQLKVLHEMKRAMWRRVLSRAQSKVMVWERRDTDGDV